MEIVQRSELCESCLSFAKMLAAVAVSIFVFLLRTADADVTFNDLPGVYDVVRNGLAFCGKVLNVRSSGNDISSMKFDGVEECRAVSATLEQKRADASSRGRASLGTFLITPDLVCRPSNSVTLLLFNPSETVNLAVTGFADPYQIRPGIKYIMFIGKTDKGSCVYQQRGASPSRLDDNSGSGGGNGGAGVQSPDNGSNTGATGGGNTGGGGGVTNPDSGSDTKGTGGSGTGGDSSIWVWLGPVPGAIATIAAAFITVYCVRNGIYPTDNGDTTGIAGGVHINVGGGPSDKSHTSTAT